MSAPKTDLDVVRQRIVVDTETNGLDVDRHDVFEVSWWNLDTDDRETFVAPHDVGKLLMSADVEALRINRYIDRIPGRPQDASALHRLHQVLQGNTLVGSNPAFDAKFLAKIFKAKTARAKCEPWHHRLWDVSAYAAGVLGLKELPGLYKLCQLLDVDPGDHSAEGDVTATVLCIRRLDELLERFPPEAREVAA